MLRGNWIRTGDAITCTAGEPRGGTYGTLAPQTHRPRRELAQTLAGRDRLRRTHRLDWRTAAEHSLRRARRLAALGAARRIGLSRVASSSMRAGLFLRPRRIWDAAD